ncbi:hypothetical protein ABXT08_15875 [Chryseobacterium sp. NRRL B-14859]|uniref:hypothetical protein n=1 Tax=Chryseobacterium sp. NRRL B-14859 TaxID=1562763 RepID=UPI003395B65A
MNMLMLIGRAKNKLILLFVIINISYIKAQQVTVELLNHDVVYKNDDGYHPVSIRYKLFNKSRDCIYLVLDKRSFGIFSYPGKYIFDKEGAEIPKDQMIFNPRLLLLQNKNPEDTLKLTNLKSVPQFTPDEFDKRSQQELKIKNDSTEAVRKYKNLYFRSQPLDWVIRAKYINDNIVFIKPGESVILNTDIDFALYDYNPYFENGVGYSLAKNEYQMIIKIHNDPSLIKEYLDERNAAKIRRFKAFPLKGDYYSGKGSLQVEK